MAVYQKQIAEKLGVSITLVSRVLAGKAEEIGIAKKTIERVLKTAEEMGYVPNAAALALKGKATRTIGVVVYDFKDPFFGAIVEHLQIQAREHDYSLILAGFLNRTPDEKDLQPLYKHTPDALIVVGSDLNANWIEKFQHIPIARIGHGADTEASVRISVDEPHAAHLLLNYLAETGRKNAVYVSAKHTVHHLRCSAVAEAAQHSGINLSVRQSEERDAYRTGMQAVKEINLSETDVIICANDKIAMGALHTLNDSGIRIPEKAAVIGFDDIDAAAEFIPAITTIQQPIGEMVKTAMNAVIEQTDPTRIDIAPQLIKRQSA